MKGKKLNKRSIRLNTRRLEYKIYNSESICNVYKKLYLSNKTADWEEAYKILQRWIAKNEELPSMVKATAPLIRALLTINSSNNELNDIMEGASGIKFQNENGSASRTYRLGVIRFIDHILLENREEAIHRNSAESLSFLSKQCKMPPYWVMVRNEMVHGTRALPPMHREAASTLTEMLKWLQIHFWEDQFHSLKNTIEDEDLIQNSLTNGDSNAIQSINSDVTCPVETNKRSNDSSNELKQHKKMKTENVNNATNSKKRKRKNKKLKAVKNVSNLQSDGLLSK